MNCKFVLSVKNDNRLPLTSLEIYYIFDFRILRRVQSNTILYIYIYHIDILYSLYYFILCIYNIKLYIPTYIFLCYTYFVIIVWTATNWPFSLFMLWFKLTKKSNGFQHSIERISSVAYRVASLWNMQKLVQKPL